MRWRNPSNRRLAETIVATFRSSPEESRRSLAAFDSKDWKKTEFWLDASGLALYFLDHVQSVGIEDAVDRAVIQRLRKKLAENKERRAHMFEEFVAINNAFQSAGVPCANLKGFTLSPHSCPNPDLRFQIDFDLLIAPEHRDVCRSLLKARGYLLTVATALTWEFKAGTSQALPQGSIYRASPRRSVELHSTADETDAKEVLRDPRLERLDSWNGFPALSSADQLIGQAMHILAHLRSPMTRPSWLLEFRNHVMAHKNDRVFWQELRMLARSHRHAKTAFGLAIWLATELFGAFSPPELNEWTLDCLAPRVRLWAEHYGLDAVFADIPGVKLYLLLEGELTHGERTQRKSRLQMLVPLQRVPRVMHSDPNDSLQVRLYQELIQLRFTLFRLRFHLTQGVLYALEARRWKRLLQRESVASASSFTVSSDTSAYQTFTSAVK